MLGVQVVPSAALAQAPDTEAATPETAPAFEDPASSVSPIGIALFSPVSLFHEKSGSIYGLGIEVVYGVTSNMVGLQVGGLVTEVKRSLIGMQIVGALGMVEGDAIGIQIGGVGATSETSAGLQIGTLLTVATKRLRGVQIGFLNEGGALVIPRTDGAPGYSAFSPLSSYGAQIGILNITSHYTGLQLAALINAENSDFTGAQIGALANASGEISGAQIGLINYAGKVSGLQIGAINVCKQLRGLQLGGFNIATENSLPFMVGMNVGL